MADIKLLIVEDDEDQRCLILEALEGHFGAGTVTAVPSRIDALSLPLESFDMILCDYNLPDCCGLDLLADVKARCDTPVVMVTGENVGHIAAEAIQKGACDYVVKFGDYLFTIPLVIEKNLSVAKVRRENRQLACELERTLLELQSKNAQLQESLQRVEVMAGTDPLTQLYNRRHFSKVLDQMFSEAQRFDTDLTCVMIDLDHYKQINDTRGHQIGDQLLIAVGKVVTANLRRMDVAARYGGDEFILLLPHTYTDESTKVAQRIRDDYYTASAAVLGGDAGVHMSMGVGTMRHGYPASAHQLIALADRALYRAKELGRNRIETYDAVLAHAHVTAQTPAAA